MTSTHELLVDLALKLLRKKDFKTKNLCTKITCQVFVLNKDFFQTQTLKSTFKIIWVYTEGKLKWNPQKCNSEKWSLMLILYAKYIHTYTQIKA